MELAPAAATLSCVCQKTKIVVAHSPIARLECCCMDCRKGVDWCRALREKKSSLSLMADLVYFPNWIQVVSGQDNLKPYLIKEGYDTVRVVATCCWTPLVGNHPLYTQRRFVAYEHPLTLTFHKHNDNDIDDDDDVVALPPPTRRIFTNDLTPQQLESLPPFLAIQKTKNNNLFPDPPDLEALAVKFPEFETLQTLIQRIGPVLFMDPNYQGKPTEWQQLYGSIK